MAKLTMIVPPFTVENVVRAAKAISSEIARRGLEDDNFRQWVLASGNGDFPAEAIQFETTHPFRVILDNLYDQVAEGDVSGAVYYYILKDAVSIAVHKMHSQLA